MIDKTLEHTLLFDFYGELLTEHQREVFQMHYLDDLSLGEISQEKEITRQAIFDLLKRSEKTLVNYESKLGLVNRFIELKLQIEQLNALTCALEAGLQNEGQLSPQVYKQAEAIKGMVAAIYAKI